MKRLHALLHTRNILTALLFAAVFALGACQNAAQQAKQKADADEFAAKFFAAIEKKPNINILPDGVMYEILKPGEGAYPTVRDTAKVNYTGMLADGTKFDSSYDRGEPADFPLDKVVPGMREGLQKINRGGKIRIYIPYAQGYGDNDMDAIPPYSILVFEVELLDFSPTPVSFF